MIIKFTQQRIDGHSSWKAAIDYIENPESETKDGAPSREKAIHVAVDHVLSPRSAIAEMRGLEALCPKTRNVLVHYVLSWPSDENPPPAECVQAAREMQVALGLAEHQAVYAVHDDTEHRHVHCITSRIHLETRRPLKINHLYRTSHRAAREIELRHGWRPAPGIFVTIQDKEGKPKIVHRSQRPRRLSVTAATIEAQRGVVSFERWAIETLFRLEERLEDGEIKTWAALERELARERLALRQKRTGFVIHDTRESQKLVLRASTIGPWFAGPALTRRLGPYTPTRPIVAVDRDRGYRAAVRRQRSKQAPANPSTTQGLWAEYQAHVQALRPTISRRNGKRFHQFFSDRTEARRQLARRIAERRRQQMADLTEWIDRSVMAALLRIEARMWRDELEAELRRRQPSKERVPDWRQWLRSQIDVGRLGATEALDELSGGMLPGLGVENDLGFEREMASEGGFGAESVSAGS